LAASALSGVRADAQTCSVVGESTFVQSAMQEWYLWYNLMPSVSPASYDSPEAYLDAVRYTPLDHGFSYITLQSTSSAFLTEGQTIALGVLLRLEGDVYRVLEVYPGSPAAEAGLERGAGILEINGRTIADYVAKGDLGTATGPAAVGVSVSLRFLDRANAEHSVTAVKRVINVTTTDLVKVFDVGGKRVGHLYFRSFITPATASLDAAFAQLQAAGVSELILDERYNGGGLVSVAQQLASQVGGSRVVGQPFAVFTHNDKQSAKNETYRFLDEPTPLGVQRLVVITTRSTASASELVVNSLRPFLQVVTVGDTSYGKPVGQYGFNFCDKVLFPVAFQVTNAAGKGDYFAGIPADCAAVDDAAHLLGDPAEASLAEALYFTKNGACSAAATSSQTARVLRAARVEPRPTGWQSVVNVY
jgi:C-terminal processing protease CtpA/Prc